MILKGYRGVKNFSINLLNKLYKSIDLVMISIYNEINIKRRTKLASITSQKERGIRMKNKSLMQVVDTIKYHTYKEKGHLERMLRKKYKDVKLTFLDNNMIMYEYLVHKKDSLNIY